MTFLLQVLAAIVVNALLAPKPPKRKPAELSDFQFPTAEEGRPIPVVFGEVWVNGSNVIWYGDLKSKKIKKRAGLFGSKQTVGMKYYLGMDVAICRGEIDEIQDIQFDEKSIATSEEPTEKTISYEIPNTNITVSGSIPVPTHSTITPAFPISGRQKIEVKNEKLFGGAKKEGGILGTIEFFPGSQSETASEYLQSRLEDVPGYRGIARLVFEQTYITANSTYIKPIRVKVKRILGGWNTNIFYPSRAEVNGRMNPAHIIYQCLTDPDWGMSWPTADIDSTSFTNAADALFNEGLGLSIVWSQQTTIESFIQEILDHINAAFYLDPETGLFGLKLIRDDFDSDQILELNNTNSTLNSFERSGVAEAVNEITVTYTDQTTGKDSAVTHKNDAAIMAAGGIISETRHYAGISNAIDANKICARDIKISTAPVSRVDIKANRAAASLKVGEPFKLNFPSHGIESAVYRAVRVTGGTLEKPEVKIKAVEDIFSLGQASYIAQESGGWTDPASPPETITSYNFLNLTYVDLIKVSDKETVDSLPAGGLFVQAIADKPNGSTSEIVLAHSENDVDFFEVDSDSFTPKLRLSSAITESDKIFNVVTVVELEDTELPEHALIKSQNGLEWIEIESYAGNTITVKRGVIDSQPLKHDAGSNVYLTNGERVPTYEAEQGANSFFKLVGRNYSGTSDPADFASVNFDSSSFDDYLRPYRAANVKIADQSFPEVIDDARFSFSWGSRNRFAAGGTLVDHFDQSVAAAQGVFYELKIYDIEGNVILDRPVVWPASGGECVASYTGETTHFYRVEITTDENGLKSDPFSFSFKSGVRIVTDSADRDFERSISSGLWSPSIGRNLSDSSCLLLSERTDAPSVNPFSGVDCLAGGDLATDDRSEVVYSALTTPLIDDALIDTGNQKFVLEFKQFHEFAANGAILAEVRFLDGAGAQIAAQTIAQQTTPAGVWTQRRGFWNIPALTREIEVYITAIRIAGGGGVDAFVDDLDARIIKDSFLPSYLLFESSDHFVAENGDRIILEN